MTNGDMIQEMFHVVGYTPIYICTGDDEKKEGFRVHIENAFKRDFSLSVSKEWWEGEYKKTATPKPKMRKCMWIKYDYRTICPKKHDVGDPYWRIPENRKEVLKYCPYCGLEIEIEGSEE